MVTDIHWVLPLNPPNVTWSCRPVNQRGCPYRRRPVRTQAHRGAHSPSATLVRTVHVYAGFDSCSCLAQVSQKDGKNDVPQAMGEEHRVSVSWTDSRCWANSRETPVPSGSSPSNERSRHKSGWRNTAWLIVSITSAHCRPQLHAAARPMGQPTLCSGNRCLRPSGLGLVASLCCSSPQGPEPSFEVFISHSRLCKVSLSSPLYAAWFEPWVGCQNTLQAVSLYSSQRHAWCSGASKHFTPSSLAAWLALFTFLSFMKTHQIQSSEMHPLDAFRSIQKQSENRCKLPSRTDPGANKRMTASGGPSRQLFSA